MQKARLRRIVFYPPWLLQNFPNGQSPPVSWGINRSDKSLALHFRPCALAIARRCGVLETSATATTVSFNLAPATTPRRAIEGITLIRCIVRGIHRVYLPCHPQQSNCGWVS